METRYLLTVMWRYQKNYHQHMGGWQYQTCIHYSPTKYMLENWDGQMEVEHVILNSHQITEEEYALLQAETTIEDFTRDESRDG